MLRIGEFAQLGNVSIRALRFYHEAGLLEPAHIDPSNNYRSYAPRQLRELQDIRLYKNLQFSLAEIRRLIRGRPSPVELREVLRERRALLKRRIEDDLSCLARIDAQLHVAVGVHDQAGYHIEIRQIQPMWVAASRERIRSYEEADDLFVEIERRVAPELLAGKRAALWHTCASDGPQIDCEALRFLKHPVSRPTREVRVYQMPAVRVASLIHTGLEQTIPQAYRALNTWLRRNNFISSGPKREIYWIEPHTNNESESLTEIQLPVFPSGDRDRVQRLAA